MSSPHDGPKDSSRNGTSSGNAADGAHSGASPDRSLFKKGNGHGSLRAGSRPNEDRQPGDRDAQERSGTDHESSASLPNRTFRKDALWRDALWEGQEALWQGNLWRDALEQAGESIIITTPELDAPGPEIIYVNRAFTQMTGYAPNEVVGLTPRILQGPRTDPGVMRRLRQRLSARQPFSGETINYRKDGTPFYISWRIRPILDGRGDVSYWIASQRDVTQRRELEQELLQIQAREQQRIATALHNDVLQRFNGLYALTSSLKAALAPGAGHTLSMSPDMIRRRLDTLERLADEGIEAAHSISHSLSPGDLRQEKLLFALRELCETAKANSGIDCTFSYEGLILLEDRTTGIHLYRIVQEALSNAIRHSQASIILVGLSMSQDEVSDYSAVPPTDAREVILTIKDDGIGLPARVLDRVHDDNVRDSVSENPESTPPDEPSHSPSQDVLRQGVGLSTMRYRARQMGGHLRVKQPDTGGTIISVVFPLPSA